MIVLGIGIEKAMPVLKLTDKLKNPGKMFTGCNKKFLASHLVNRSKKIRSKTKLIHKIFFLNHIVLNYQEPSINIQTILKKVKIQKLYVIPTE